MIQQEAALLAALPRRLLVGGEWREAGGGGRLEVEDPATGEVIAEVADGDPADGVVALQAAERAQGGWAAEAPRRRGEVLRAAFERVTERSRDLALLMTLEMGKPLAESRAEVAYAAEFLRWYSEEAVRVEGRFATAPDGGGHLLTMRRPVGPCVLVTPWNFPLAMVTRKLGPALAAGCTVVLKPAAQTPLTALVMAEILEECGLPPGVLNVITTSRAGEVVEPLLRDARARKLSFTGSTRVGSRLMGLASERLLRVSMELGGNAPFIVFEDADLDAAVKGAVIAKMRNAGEACTAANRFLVAEPLAGEFSRRLAARLGAMKVGRGTDPGVEVGPLIDRPAREKVQELVEGAVGGGARVLTGGGPLDGPGYFYAPTVLGGVPADARMAREEIFGPVAPVSAFAGEEEAITSANATRYGLVAYVYTSDLKRALRVAEALEVGMLGVNQGMVSNPAAPFGGVKESGFGREGGREGMEEYLELRYLAIAR
jgi:succinate-semialdehyde dehydrogenase / glutarate-semialdehyde dehydrogenase